MSPAHGAGATTSAKRVRSTLLARLGLDAAADEHDVESAHDRIVDYLETAPTPIRGWADKRQEEVDRVFALLTGPESELAQLAPSESPTRAAVEESKSARTNRVLMGVIAALVTLGLVYGVYAMGRPAVPDLAAGAGANATQTTAPVLDQAKLAELTAKVKADPKDITSLQAIADLYFDAEDWANAKASSQKVLDLDPKNAGGLISLGAAAYNSGDMATAEATWKTGVAAHPENVELHYDLGFLYMTTGRTDLMEAQWKKVVEIDPNGQLAKMVQSQVGEVTTPSPTSTK